ncbi:MAG: AAA family ATPase [Treponema sp.]|nr:AAA family ATPase [Treponema sp.]
MRLKGVSITNFRSIKSTGYISLESKSIIIGPNNEGKSNILQGIVIAVTRIFGRDNTSRRIIYSRSRDDSLIYDWERDFPLDLQENESKGKTVFKLFFDLNKQECDDLSYAIGLKIKDDLMFTLTCDKEKESIEVRINDIDKKCNRSNDLSEIINYIHSRFSFYYIPAIRPKEYSIQIIDELLEERLNSIKKETEYQKALQKILDYQKPIIDELSNQLTESIKSFIPEIKCIEVSRKEEISRLVSRNLSILVEDNIKTDIQRKGDGIKSLIAISLVNHMALEQSDKSIFLAIEEPESHLHPGAIHRLNTIIDDICKNQQVIITTHSPVLIDRICIGNNILVNKNKASPASNIKDIRNTIGVDVSDNLTNTRFVLLVEGKSDERIIRKWLSYDTEIKQMLDNSILSITSLSGGNNLAYLVGLYRSMLCNVFFFLDYDKCGKESFENAKKQDLINQSDGSFAVLQGVKESEIEDLIDVTVYSNKIFEDYGVNLNTKKYSNLKGKWSDNIKRVFISSGKLWDNKIEDEIKTLVADAVVSYPGNGIKNSCSGPIDNLISIIKARIK